MLDATAKGGLGRYLNHSCGPNCETQYWMVRGETRVGIFAKDDIKKGTELCYDYNLQWNGFARVKYAHVSFLIQLFTLSRNGSLRKL